MFILGAKASSVEIETVPCTAISMSIFDRLEEKGIVQEGGYIRKCLEEYIENVCLGDQLRNVSTSFCIRSLTVYSGDN